MAPNRSDSEGLQRILGITRLMAATVDLDSLLGLIIDSSMDLLDAERASLLLYDSDTNELVSRIAVGAEEIRFPGDRGIAGATISAGATINVPDAYEDDRFNPNVDKATGFHTRSILSVPLRDFQGDLVGVLPVLNKHDGPFIDADVSLAETLAAQAGVSLQRARLMEHYAQKLEMERAMKIARDIQQALLPQEQPKICGFDVAGMCEPADKTGSDTYDFMPLLDGQWLLTVADASGHGIGPALVIAETRAMLRASSLQGCDLPRVLATTNSLLSADLEGRFVTCFLGVLDPLAGRMTYASAGHGPMLFYDRQRGEFEQVSATSLPLGITAEVDYTNIATHDFAPGNIAVILTDGFFEAINSADEMFGLERLTNILRRDCDLPAEQMIRRLHGEITDFIGELDPQDDCTVVVIRRQ